MAYRVNITPHMMREVQVALGASPFSDLARFLPTPVSGRPETRTSNETLFALAGEIGQRNEALGIGLFACAVRASQAANSGQLVSAWEGFAKLIAGKGGAEEETSAEETSLVSFELFQKVIRVLRDPDQRMQWIREGITTLGVPSPRDLIDSSPLSLQEKGSVTFSVVRGKRQFFQTYAKQYSPGTSASLHFVIETPGDWARPLTEEEVHLLLARAFLFEDLASRGGLELARPYQTVTPESIREPLPVVFAEQDGVVRYSGPRVSSSQREEWEDVWQWFAYGVELLNRARRGKASDVVAMFEIILDEQLQRRVSRLEAPQLVQGSWLEVLQCLNAATLFREALNRLALQSPRIRFDLLERLGEEIQIGLEGGGPPFIRVQIAPSLLKRLRGEDLMEIAWRALTLRDEIDLARTRIDSRTRGEARRRQGYRKIPDRGLITLSDLRQGTGLSPQAKRGRSYLRLLLAYFQVKRGAPASGPPRVEIAGPASTETQRALALALSAIRHHLTMTPIESEKVAWEDAISARHWYVQETGEEEKEVLVEVIPLGSMRLVHLHGKDLSLTPLDWLYILSLLEVNLGAIRLNLSGRSMLTGRTGQSDILYNGIAGQRILASFGVYDPKARLPENWDLALPGGVSATLNPNLSRATPDLRRRYLKALRWFASKGIPIEWQPIATDSHDRVRDRQRLMMLAWHPDRREITKVTPEEVALFTDSLPHWRAVIDLAGLKK